MNLSRFVIFLLLCTSGVSIADNVESSTFIKNMTYKGDISTAGVPPGMPAFVVKFKKVKSAVLTITDKDIDFKFRPTDPRGIKGVSAQLVVTDYRGRNNHEGVWSLEPTNKEPNRYSFLGRILANNNFVLNEDGSLKCNTCRNIGLPYIWRRASADEIAAEKSKAQLNFAGFEKGIFGIQYGDKPTEGMKYFDKNTSGKPVKWYTKKDPDVLIDGIQLEKIYYGYSENGFYSVVIKAKGRSVNQVGAKITGIYGLATKSKTAAFAVSHHWINDTFEITMNANYMRGGEGTFMISHKEK